jgi:hypothetical protein
MASQNHTSNKPEEIASEIHQQIQETEKLSSFKTYATYRELFTF